MFLKTGANVGKFSSLRRDTLALFRRFLIFRERCVGYCIFSPEIDALERYLLAIASVSSILNFDIMIQRIQSIYIFVASALTFCLFFTPFISLDLGQGVSEISVCRMSPVLQGFQPTAMSPLAILAGTAFVLCFMSIFLFRNRTLQMKVVRVNEFLQMAVLIVMLVYIYVFVKDIDTTIRFCFYLALVFPIVNAILLVLARKRIKADDDLVKSADRLR